jgi:DNA repair protein RecO
MDGKNTRVLNGIVIKSEKFGENDLRVWLLCEQGITALVATGALKPAAKLKSALQLFTVGEYTAVGRKITGADVVSNNFGITKNIKNYYLACAICEVLIKVFPNEYFDESEPEIFYLTAETFRALCDENCDKRTTFADYFGALLNFLGYSLSEKQDISGAFVQYLDVKIPNTTFFLV